MRQVSKRSIPGQHGHIGTESRRGRAGGGGMGGSTAGSSARVAEVPSPMQCPAAKYGSSFSRAVEILSGDGNHLLISGTASIAPDGGTACRANLGGQIARTMEVVESILKSRGLGFADVTRATAYFRTLAAPQSLRRGAPAGISNRCPSLQRVARFAAMTCFLSWRLMRPRFARKLQIPTSKLQDDNLSSGLRPAAAGFAF